MSVRVGLVLLCALAVVAQIPLRADAVPSLTVTPASGPPGTPLTLTGSGLPPGAQASIEWWTMEGNRVSGAGYAPVSWELGTVAIDPAGGFTFSFEAPNDLGGATPHNITVVVGGQVLAEAPFVLERHMTISPVRGPEGTLIEFEMTGGGWTQVDNIVALTYDNAFIGYACSFTNQGHISVWIQAVGAVGTHLIGVYPALYSGPTSWDPTSNPEPYKHPFLNTADMPTIYEPEFFTFEITESSQTGQSRLGGASGLHEILGAGDALVIPQVPPVVTEDGTPQLAVGNGGKGIVGGDLSYALAGFPPNAEVVFRWDTRDGVATMGGTYNDRFLGWKWTETYATLGSATTDANGRASGSLTIPEDFGNDHLLDALVGGEPIANATFKVVGRFTATLSEDGSQVRLHGTGLGWEKYTAGYNVLYDGKAMGFISGLESRGTAEAAIPVVGEEGLHTIEVFGGQNGYPFLNKHETSWPWERVYRFAFTIQEVTSGPPTPPTNVASLPVWALPPLLVIAVVGGYLAARIRRRGKTVSEPAE